MSAAVLAQRTLNNIETHMKGFLAFQLNEASTKLAFECLIIPENITNTPSKKEPEVLKLLPKPRNGEYPLLGGLY